MALANFEKDPSAVLDFTLDWSSWLASGETISTSTWTVPTGLTKDSSSNTATATTVWLSGGTAGQFYPYVNRIVTSQARTDERTIVVGVRDR